MLPCFHSCQCASEQHTHRSSLFEIQACVRPCIHACMRLGPVSENCTKMWGLWTVHDEQAAKLSRQGLTKDIIRRLDMVIIQSHIALLLATFAE